MNDGILSAIGNTPLVRLTRLFKHLPFQVYAKLEGLNPGGSIKDRPALSILRNALETGVIGPDTVVIESSSGNMGIGMAQACTYFGLRLICVVDPKTTTQNIRLLRAFGAEVDMIDEPDPETGEFLQARINRVRALRAAIKNSYWPNQYAHLHNPVAHHTTMREIAAAFDGGPDYLFCATSTCGTVRGCAEYVREHGLRTKVIAVDAVGSVIFGGQRSRRLIPGHGAAVVPELFRADMADTCVHVSDLDCVVGCRRLVRQEAILAGGSSGAVATAVESYRAHVPDGANCVAIFADRGERYLDTIYSDEWVEHNFGNVLHLWQETGETQACVMATS